MTVAWRFNEVRPSDRMRESQVEKFFKAHGDRANPIVREGIQNSLDAAPDDKIVRVRLTVGEWTPAQSRERWGRYADGLSLHLDAVRAKLPEPPEPGEPFRYLLFEDFETTGLTGDPTQWLFSEAKNPFFDFFRAEGISHKEGSDRGRHGVGKFVFMGASRIRTIFGLTRRDDGRELLMGTTVLSYHEVNGNHYVPDGWFGIPDPNQRDHVLPLEADKATLAKFKADFGISRGGESGLTIVVPWLDNSILLQSLIPSVIANYFLPLMRNLLVVEVVDNSGKVERIDSVTIKDVMARQAQWHINDFASRLELSKFACGSKSPIVLAPPPGGNTAPKWSEECVPPPAIEVIRAKLKSGEMIHVECPTRVRFKKTPDAIPDKFDLYFQRVPGESDTQVYFIRQGILVSDIRTRKHPGLRGMVVIDDGDLGKFLGDAENPAHTDWQSELVKHYMFNKATIDYVVESIDSILQFAKEDETAPDPMVMIDLFYEPDDAPESPEVKRKKNKKDPGGETEPAKLTVTPKPKSYRLTKRDGGFVLRNGDDGVPTPTSFEILIAYDTQQGNPFKKYHPADFRLDKGDGITAESEGLDITEYSHNRIIAHVLKDTFELVVEGFDTNRDVVVHVKPFGPKSKTRDENEQGVADGEAV